MYAEKYGAVHDAAEQGVHAVKGRQARRHAQNGQDHREGHPPLLPLRIGEEGVPPAFLFFRSHGGSRAPFDTPMG